MREFIYQIVVEESKHWTPTRTQRSFGVSAILDIVSIPFLEAVAIKKRMKEEGVLPTKKY